MIYALDNASAPALDNGGVDGIKKEVWAPLTTFEQHKGASTNPDVNPNFIFPRQGLFRLQKLMDEYAGGGSAGFTNNEATLALSPTLRLLK